MPDKDEDNQPVSSNNDNAIRAAVQAASTIWSSQTASSLDSAEDSQQALKKQLDALEKDMHMAANALAATGSISEITTRSINEAQECLLRAKRKLVSVRARVGRLRTFEEAHRLSVARDTPPY